MNSKDEFQKHIESYIDRYLEIDAEYLSESKEYKKKLNILKNEVVCYYKTNHTCDLFWEAINKNIKYNIFFEILLNSLDTKKLQTKYNNCVEEIFNKYEKFYYLKVDYTKLNINLKKKIAEYNYNLLIYCLNNYKLSSNLDSIILNKLIEFNTNVENKLKLISENNEYLHDLTNSIQNMYFNSKNNNYIKVNAYTNELYRLVCKVLTHLKKYIKTSDVKKEIDLFIRIKDETPKVFKPISGEIFLNSYSVETIQLKNTTNLDIEDFINQYNYELVLSLIYKDISDAERLKYNSIIGSIDDKNIRDIAILIHKKLPIKLDSKISILSEELVEKYIKFLLDRGVFKLNNIQEEMMFKLFINILYEINDEDNSIYKNFNNLKDICVLFEFILKKYCFEIYNETFEFSIENILKTLKSSEIFRRDNTLLSDKKFLDVIRYYLVGVIHDNSTTKYGYDLRNRILHSYSDNKEYIKTNRYIKELLFFIICIVNNLIENKYENTLCIDNSDYINKKLIEGNLDSIDNVYINIYKNTTH